MDDTPADHGAPVYLKGSHRNKSVKDDAVFVQITDGDLPDYPEQLQFPVKVRPQSPTPPCDTPWCPRARASRRLFRCDAGTEASRPWNGTGPLPSSPHSRSPHRLCLHLLLA